MNFDNIQEKFWKNFRNCNEIEVMITTVEELNYQEVILEKCWKNFKVILITRGRNFEKIPEIAKK